MNYKLRNIDISIFNKNKELITNIDLLLEFYFVNKIRGNLFYIYNVNIFNNSIIDKLNIRDFKIGRNLWSTNETVLNNVFYTKKVKFKIDGVCYIHPEIYKKSVKPTYHVV